MEPIFQPERNRDRRVRRLALVLALALIGILCGSVIHGVRTMEQERVRDQRVNSQMSTRAVSATNATIAAIFKTV